MHHLIHAFVNNKYDNVAVPKLFQATDSIKIDFPQTHQCQSKSFSLIQLLKCDQKIQKKSLNVVISNIIIKRKSTV